MFNYDSSYKYKWLKKVVLLQNGGGKTLASKKLEEDLKAEGFKTKRFTRREIETMVAETGSNIYMGESAEKALLRDELKQTINNSSIIKDDVREISKTSSAKGAKEKNFFYGCQNIQNLNSLIKIPNYKGNAIKNLDLNNNEIFNDLCSNLDSSLFNECKDINLLHLNKDAYPYPTENDIPYDYEKSLIDLIVFVKSTKKKTCIFCGKRYRSHDSLIKALDIHYHELNFVKDISDETIVINCANKIISDINKKKSPFLLSIFNNAFAKTIYQAVRIVKIYLSICYTFLDFYWKKLSSKEIISLDRATTYGELLGEYYSLEKEINKTNSEIKNLKKFNQFLTAEVNSLIDVDGGYSVGPMDDGVGIVLYKENVKSKEKLYEILSESQYKRLCLIALKALIRYGVVDAVILDDPVDSYDDYNKIKTISYISDILKSKRVKKWYILTNDFESMFLLIECIRCSTYIYLPDFSPTFNGSFDLIECECTSREVLKYLRKNDLFYLSAYLQKDFEPLIARELMTCALLMTLRNIKVEAIDKIDNFIVYESTKIKCPNTKCKAYINSIKENTLLMNDIEDSIEARAEHYSPSSSATLTVGEICALFHSLEPKKRVGYPHVNCSNSTLFEDYRKLAANSRIVYNSSWTTVLNYLLKKMTVVSFVKYEFEKKIILRIQSVFDSRSLNNVVKEHGLFKKISAAIQINKDSGFGLEDFLKQCLSIHEKYSIIYNSFDHGLIYQIMPYYSTSTRDIEALWQEVQRL